MMEKRAGNDKFMALLGIVTAVWMVFMLLSAGSQSLWMDDIAQIDIAWQDTIGDLIKDNIRLDNNPPLSHILCYFWLRLVPYGTGWLKAFNILWTGAGIFLCGILGHKIGNGLAGIIASVLCASTYGLIYFSAYTFRPYGMLFFLSQLVLYVYMMKNERKGWKKDFGYAVCMTALVYTHYFGVLICIAFGICDVILLLRKKRRFFDFWPYCVAAGLFIPWLLLVITNSVERLATFWPDKPDLSSIGFVIYELMGYNRIMEAIAIIGFVGAILIAFYKRRIFPERHLEQRLVLFIPIFVIGIVFLFSRFSTHFTSLFVSRYFVCVFPFMMIAVGCFYANIFEILKKVMRVPVLVKAAYFLIACGCLFCVLKNGLNVHRESQKLNQPFEEVADYLMQQEDIYRENVLVFNTNQLELQRGWEYYLTHKGERRAIDVVWAQLPEKILEDYDKVYLVTLHVALSQEVVDTLERAGFYLSGEDEILPIMIYTK